MQNDFFTSIVSWKTGNAKALSKILHLVWSRLLVDFSESETIV